MNFINRIFNWLDKKNIGSENIYIGGTDEIESEYDEACANANIGVLAKNDTVGHILLSFLKIIINKNPELLEEYMDFIENDEINIKQIHRIDDETLDEIMECFGDGDAHVKKYPSNKSFVHTYSYLKETDDGELDEIEEHKSQNPENMSLYNLADIYNELMVFYK